MMGYNPAESVKSIAKASKRLRATLAAPKPTAQRPNPRGNAAPGRAQTGTIANGKDKAVARQLWSISLHVIDYRSRHASHASTTVGIRSVRRLSLPVSGPPSDIGVSRY